MPRAKPYTLLSLSRYAEIMGLDPLHFASGYSAARPLPGCGDVWFQYAWQNPQLVSREEVARCIHKAERDIADTIRYWPGPMWIADERHEYPRMYRRDLVGYGRDLRYRRRQLRTNWGYVIEGGQRATDQLGGAAIAYVAIDADNDGFDETAVFTLNVAADLDVAEVHAYFKPYAALDIDNTRTDPASADADPAWEVRPISCTLAGTVLTVYVKVWELFSPALQETLAIDADLGTANPIDADAAASYVDELVFYRVYNNPATQVQFVWGADVGCSDVSSACNVATQSGCMRIQNERNGLVVLSPGTYNATTEEFANAAWTTGYEPDFLQLWYRCGAVDPRTGCCTLSDSWAQIIAMLATARLTFPLCTCDLARERVEHWRYDRAAILESLGRSYVTTETDLSNPFGTRTGEIEAWKQVTRGRNRAIGQAVIT